MTDLDRFLDNNPDLSPVLPCPLCRHPMPVDTGFDECYPWDIAYHCRQCGHGYGVDEGFGLFTVCGPQPCPGCDRTLTPQPRPYHYRCKPCGIKLDVHGSVIEAPRYRRLPN